MTWRFSALVLFCTLFCGSAPLIAVELGQDQTNVDVPAKLLPFKLMGLDGKKYALADVSKGKPVLFVYLERDPALRRGVRDINRLSDLLKNKVRVVGLYAGELAESRRFTRKNHIRFPVFCDTAPFEPDTPVLLRTFGDRYGTNILTMGLVLPDGKIVDRAGGYSQITLRAMFQKLQKATGKRISISLRKFPKQFFCGETRIWGLTPP